MELLELYETIGGDYNDVRTRLVKDERIIKYLKKFRDGDDMALILDAYAKENYEEMFRNVHNLKGVSMNLGIVSLRDVSEPLCEAVRHGRPECDITAMVREVKECYDSIVSKLQCI